MQVEFDDLDVLVEIQKIDLAVIQAKKARAELPQRIEVVKVRKKRDEIAPKVGQVIELQTAKEAEITLVEDEDRGLAEKQQRSQEEIDNASADYRRVDSLSKDMAGIVKRRVTLEERLKELNAELDKIKGVRAQLEGAIATLEKHEEDLRSSFKEQDDALIERVRQLLGDRAELAKRIPVDLMSLYDETAAKTGGVALGKLEEDRCGVCRTVIDSGHLIDLRAQAPLGICPSCKRLLIVE